MPSRDRAPGVAGPLNPSMAATEAPPVMEARRWIAGRRFPPERPLINVSQAAPAAPPPLPLRRAIAEAALGDDAAHVYGPDLGLPDLRETLAGHMSRLYGGAVSSAQVAIQPGCNHAFAAAAATLAGPGDEVILPLPWYFNHAMWLTMSGVRPVALETDAGLLPDPDAAARLIGPRTRAIALVTPNNPAGVEYPPERLADFRDLARRRGIALVLDETYRDFRARDGAPHGLFADPGWDDVLIHLYSFSKAYRLTGHRTGAVAAAPSRLAEIEKFTDTVSICPPQLGQRAALWGLRHLGDWLEEERRTILDRRAAAERAFAALPGWRVEASGAYFAWVAHPFDEASDALARRLVDEAAILCLPGAMFAPAGHPRGRGALRFAFANLDEAGIADLATRLAELRS